MAEVTRVPLPDIAKGSMAKFILGVVLGVALGVGGAWLYARPDSVDVDVITAGEGPSPQAEDVVFVEYVGKLEDGTVFDQSPPRPEIPAQIADLIPEGAYLEMGGVVPGFRDALLQMQKGGHYTVTIPAELAYGANPPAGSPIPPTASCATSRSNSAAPDPTTWPRCAPTPRTKPSSCLPSSSRPPNTPIRAAPPAGEIKVRTMLPNTPMVNSIVSPRNTKRGSQSKHSSPSNSMA